ncbi:MAG: hypothetical protein AB8F95_16295 [Bacteroidia bacterium]
MKYGKSLMNMPAKPALNLLFGEKRFFWMILISISLVLSTLTSCGSGKDMGPDLTSIAYEAPVGRIDIGQLAASKQLDGANDVPSFLAAYNQHLKTFKKPLYAISGVNMIDLTRQRMGVSLLSEGQRDSAIAFKIGTLVSDSAFALLADSVGLQFPAEYNVRTELEPVAKRYHHYFPDIEVPALYTHVNGYDPSGQSNTIDQFFAGEGYISIGLHYFMGERFSYYSPNIPQYIKRRFAPEYLDVMLAHELAKGTTPPLDPANQTSLLDAMVQQGIQYYIVEKLVPAAEDSMVMLYSEEEMAWASQYERSLFKDAALVMFESDMMKKRKYLGENAFSSMYSDQSAPRIGAFLGWRIVRSYMKRNSDVSLADLVQSKDFEAIFRASGYKP